MTKLDDKLREIIEPGWSEEYGPGAGRDKGIDEAVIQIKQELEQFMLELVGRERPIRKSPEEFMIYSSRRLQELDGLTATNNLIVELRQKIKEAFS